MTKNGFVAADIRISNELFLVTMYLDQCSFVHPVVSAKYNVIASELNLKEILSF